VPATHQVHQTPYICQTANQHLLADRQLTSKEHTKY
jgi:hypothetical protein